MAGTGTRSRGAADGAADATSRSRPRHRSVGVQPASRSGVRRSAGAPSSSPPHGRPAPATAHRGGPQLGIPISLRAPGRRRRAQTRRTTGRDLATRSPVVGWRGGRRLRRMATRTDRPVAVRRIPRDGSGAPASGGGRRRDRCVGRGPQAELLGRRPSSVLRPALESLPGWSWAGRSERRWPTRYAAAMPPDNAVAGRLHIGEWATAQRRAHAAGNLPKPLTEQLDALPGWQWTEDR